METIYDLIQRLIDPGSLEMLAGSCLTLMMLGSAFLVTYRAGFLNLAISAQLVAGSIAFCVIFHRFDSEGYGPTASLASASLVSLVILNCIIAIPTYLKTNLGVDEVLTTLLIHFMASPLAQFALGNDPSSSSTSTPEVSFDGLKLYGDYISYPNVFGAIFAVIIVGAFMRKRETGYLAKILNHKQDLFTDSKNFRTLMTLQFIASILLLFVIVSVILVTENKYTPPKMEQDGFMGLAVALLALLRFIWIPVAAALIAFTQQLFVQCSTLPGLKWTEGFWYLCFGLILIGTARLLGVRGSEDD